MLKREGWLNMVDDALISVIICTKNRPKLLLQSIDSVLAQTCQDWELVIVDDGSSQPIESLVTGHIAEHNVRFSCIRHEHSQGIAIARNTGVAKSSGRYLYFLDDDDLLTNNALQELLQTLQEFSLMCLFHNVKPFGKDADVKADELLRANSRILTAISIKKPRDGVCVFGHNLFERLLFTVPLSFQRFMVTRELWNTTGGMRPSAEMPEPEWAVKAALLGECGLILEPLGLWRVDGQNIFSLKKDEYKIQDRVVDNMQSLLHFAENSGQVNAKEKLLIKHSLGKAYFDLAWGCLGQNQRIRALAALCKSALIQYEFKHIKLLARLCLPKLG